jgi:hypothetical protein
MEQHNLRGYPLVLDLVSGDHDWIDGTVPLAGCGCEPLSRKRQVVEELVPRCAVLRSRAARE